MTNLQWTKTQFQFQFDLSLAQYSPSLFILFRLNALLFFLYLFTNVSLYSKVENVENCSEVVGGDQAQGALKNVYIGKLNFDNNSDIYMAVSLDERIYNWASRDS